MNDQTANSTRAVRRLSPLFQRLFWFLVLAISLATTLPSTADDFADGKQAFEAKQYEKAIRLLRPLAEKRDARAQYLLGYAFFSSKGVHEKQAEYWLRKAVDQDHTAAFVVLGNLLMHKDRSARRGLPLLEVAVRRGHPGAQVALGAHYLIGRPGIPVNMEESRRLLLLAADQKYKGAFLFLSMWYASDHGKKPDYVELLKWAVIDARIGVGPGIFADTYRSRALKHLNQAQVVEANRRAAAWLKAHGETP
ncbi:MAG: sel1 repeat family protein [Alphaproteobacteria bacterium]|nr:sel1 repeat family protein [Alphaproteobacteria bacterium]